jgi:hypothetical protein
VATNGSPRFSLLWGTNRNKSEQEIMLPACTLPDAGAVKDALSGLAKGEWVTWVETAPNAQLAFPSKEIVRELLDHAKSLNITLNVSESAR